MANSTPEEKLLNIIRKDSSRVKLKRELKLFTKVNIILAGIIGVLAIIFLVDLFIFKEDIPNVPKTDSSNTVNKVEPIAANVEKDIEMLNMPANTNKEIKPKKASAQEIKAKFNLIGIMTGDNNQAIIEDKTLQKTLFLYKGDKVGDCTVEDIKNNTVILDCKGEKIELSM